MLEKSFLRWAGSKQKLIPCLKEYWDSSFERYVEPFAGSAKLFFAVKPTKAILSDTNQQLIETYGQICKSPYPIYQILKTFKATKSEYYKVRAINPRTLGINQRAARFIFLNKLCFNGLYRTNASGLFNVPFSGETAFDADAEYENLKLVSQSLKDTKIICGDFEEVVKKNLRAGDFVYLDPPYAVENRRIFRQYGPHTFGLDDLARVSELLTFINKKKAHFLLSYAYCPEALRLFRKWPIRKKFAQRNIAGFAEHRKRAAEILVSNIDVI